VQAIAGFAGVAVADAVGQDDKEFRGVEELTRTEEAAGEERREEVSAAAGGAVHDEDGVSDLTGVIFDGLTKRGKVDIQLREGGLAALEGEVRYFIVSFGLVGVGCGGGLLRLLRLCEAGEGEENEQIFHDGSFDSGECIEVPPFRQDYAKSE
jgi:hypothetical protein